MKIKPTLHGRYRFHCPGCKFSHSVDSSTWTVDLTTETITPSVLVYERKMFIDGTLEGDALLAPQNIAETPRCHSFVTNGKIQYLSDSTHEFSGQTIDLPELNERDDQ